MEPGVSEERSGRPHDGEEDFGLDELGAVLADLRAVVVQPAPPDVAAVHLARMESAALGAAGSSAAPVRSRRHTGAADYFWTMPRRIAAAVAAVVVALFGLGGLGMAGALPGPVQDFVHTITEPLGLDVPRSDDTPGPVKGSDPSSSDPAGNEPAVTAAPGPTGSTPGQSGQTPANGSEAPGLSGTTPGQSGATPGQSGTPSVTAPGQSGNPSATAPGQSGAAPGQSGSAGANGNGNGKTGNPSVTAPGRS
jgi:hypothetical protein